jgi:hypothetical protein
LSVKIDKRLNLVVPLERADGTTLFIHSTPISPETFDQHWRIISKTFSTIHGEGFNALTGPRVAAKALRDIAKAEGNWDGPAGVDATLMNEIRRLTMVVMPRGTVPPTMFMHDAVAKGLIEPTDADIVENGIVFFIVVSAMHRPRVLAYLLEEMCGMWGAQTSSLNSTAFAASLPISTETESSGVKATG